MKPNLTSPRVVAIVQARIGSTRLPRKILKEIHGKTMLEHIIDRLEHCQLINGIVLAIAREKNSSIPKLAHEWGMQTYIGDIEDVLDRYYRAAKKFQGEIIVRITSDCPLLDPQIIDRVIAYYLKHRKYLDYVSNFLHRTFPRGLCVEVFSYETLERAWNEAKEPKEREHVTLYIYQHPQKFRLANFKNNVDLSHLRWTVDEAEDLEFVKEIYRRLYIPNGIFFMSDILRVLEAEPQLSEINKYIKQREPNG